jgi:hypothetical protein
MILVEGPIESSSHSGVEVPSDSSQSRLRVGCCSCFPNLVHDHPGCCQAFIRTKVWLFPNSIVEPPNQSIRHISKAVAYSWWGKVTGVYLIESQRNDQILTNGGDLEPKNLTGLSPPKLKLTSLILYGIAWDLSNAVAKPCLATTPKVQGWKVQCVIFLSRS